MTYNRYVRMDNGDYVRIREDPPVQNPFIIKSNPPSPKKEPPPPKPQEPPPKRPAEARAANRILEHLHLNDIDSGDLLLLSVLFFLFKQEADEELLMALGLLLIL